MDEYPCLHMRPFLKIFCKNARNQMKMQRNTVQGRIGTSIFTWCCSLQYWNIWVNFFFKQCNFFFTRFLFFYLLNLYFYVFWKSIHSVTKVNGFDCVPTIVFSVEIWQLFERVQSISIQHCSLITLSYHVTSKLYQIVCTWF